MVWRTICALILFASQISFAADIQFEGYYRINLESQPIGYVIQRYESDAKEKVFRSEYFLKTNELGGDIQESLKAEAKTKEKAEFQPVSYQYTGQVGHDVKSIDGAFKEGMMQIIRSDGKKSVKETYKIPPDTFLSTFLGYLMLQGGLKSGKKFVYSAVAEEDGNSYKGEAVVKGEEKYNGMQVYRVENTFKGERFVSFITPEGETLGTISPTKKLELVLVADAAEATKGFTVPNKSLLLTFGNIPTGKVNALAHSGSSTASKKKSEGESSPTEGE
jgi:hypothetical protein